MNYKVSITINSGRPDFRVIIAFLWGDFHNVDSDGDSYNPASTTWTELYMSDRESENCSFELSAISQDPLIFEISSENECLANKVAFFLARETQGNVINNDNLRAYETLASRLGDNFNLSKALDRADRSVWRNSSLWNPYPNLNI